jgi:hypothetical protein
VQANRKIADLTVTESDPFEERAIINKKKKEIEAEMSGVPVQSKKKKRRFLDKKDDKASSKVPKI